MFRRTWAISYRGMTHYGITRVTSRSQLDPVLESTLVSTAVDLETGQPLRFKPGQMFAKFAKYANQTYDIYPGWVEARVNIHHHRWNPVGQRRRERRNVCRKRRGCHECWTEIWDFEYLNWQEKMELVDMKRRRKLDQVEEWWGGQVLQSSFREETVRLLLPYIGSYIC